VLADLQWDGASTAPKHSLQDAAGLRDMRAMDSAVAAIRQAVARTLVTHDVGEHAQRTILQCITTAAVHATAIATVLMPELLYIPSALQSDPVLQLQGETLMRSCIVLAATNTIRYYDDCKDGKHQQVCYHAYM
jgi:hypothetical protein